MTPSRSTRTLGYTKGCPLDCPLCLGNHNQYPDGLCPVAEEVVPRMILVGTFGNEDFHQLNAERLHEAIEVVS